MPIAVAGQTIDPVAFLVHLAGLRHAGGNRQALAEGTGRDLDPRQLQPVRVTLKRRIELAQQHNFLNREVAGHTEAQVERRRLVPG